MSEHYLPMRFILLSSLPARLVTILVSLTLITHIYSILVGDDMLVGSMPKPSSITHLLARLTKDYQFQSI